MSLASCQSDLQQPTPERPWYLDFTSAKNAIEQDVCQQVGGLHSVQANTADQVSEAMDAKLNEIGANAYRGRYVTPSLYDRRYQFWAYVCVLPENSTNVRERGIGCPRGCLTRSQPRL